MQVLNTELITDCRHIGSKMLGGREYSVTYLCVGRQLLFYIVDTLYIQGGVGQGMIRALER
jgi:hypothetical protein